MFETGLAHGTVTAVLEGQPVEVTSLRRDVATDGDTDEVRFAWDARAGGGAMTVRWRADRVADLTVRLD